MSRHEVVTKEFSSEQAGERVGWVVCEEFEGAHSDFVELSTAVATVGEEGAVVSFIEYDGEEERLTHQNSIRGFVAATALSVTVPRPEGRIVDVSQFRWLNSGRTYSYGGPNKAGGVFGGITNSAAGSKIGLGANHEKAQWFAGDELASGIKAALEGYGLTQAYPTVYLTLNNAILHAEYGPSDDRAAVRPVVDPAMHEVTSAELAEASLIDHKLKLALGVDRLMRGRLTVFSDVPPDQIPESFIESRRSVAQLESEIYDSANKMLYKWGTFLPVGFRPNGRTWPYMDPTVSDEDRAFGRELEALKAGDISRANRELELEIRELDKRIEFASQGLAVLIRLREAEDLVL